MKKIINFLIFMHILPSEKAEPVRNIFAPVKKEALVKENLEMPTLLAITEINKQPMALMRYAEASYLVEIGSSIGNFELLAINQKYVTIKNEKEEITLEL